MNPPHVMLPLSRLSTEALIETRDKYVQARITGILEWERCSICVEVKNYSSAGCIATCPLTISGWCRNAAQLSKLNAGYINGDDSDTWEKRLNDYVMWIDLEIEDRYKEDEKWW